MKTTKNKFKNCLICIFFATILTLSGCSGDSTQSSGDSTQSIGDNTQSIGDNTKYVNLDMENADVIENVPKSGKWYTLKFDYKKLTKDSYNVLLDGAKAIGIAEPEKEKVLCSVNYSDDEPNADVVYPEMKDEDYARTYYMRYITDDIYIDYNLSNRFEFYNRKALREIRNEEYDRLWEWKPGFTGEAKVKSYDLSENADISDSYTLNGKQTSISAA